MHDFLFEQDLARVVPQTGCASDVPCPCVYCGPECVNALRSGACQIPASQMILKKIDPEPRKRTR